MLPQEPEGRTIIGKSLVIKGEVAGSGPLYVDGAVEGSIILEGSRVTIGRNAQVTADVQARDVVVLGSLKGKLTVSDQLDIRSTGTVTGNVVCQRIAIEEGAFFKGGVELQRPEPAATKQKSAVQFNLDLFRPRRCGARSAARGRDDKNPRFEAESCARADSLAMASRSPAWLTTERNGSRVASERAPLLTRSDLLN